MIRAYLVVSACIYLVLGVWTFIDPLGALSGVGVSVSDPAGMVELRAMYGGLELGLGSYLAFCATRPSWIRPGVALAMSSIGALGIGRVAAMAIWGTFTPLLAFLVVSEFVALASGAFLLMRTPAPT